jgi:cysteine-rich repeat protein
MRKRIKQAVILSFLLAVVVGAGACLPPPGGACGDEWCAKGYHCAFVTTPPICVKDTCGNGMIEVGEECDDSNVENNDDCLETCKLNTCGDDQVNSPIEKCDDGNRADGDGCDSNCTVTACGNGVVTAGEICDDGNGNDYDGCDHDCTISLFAYIKASNTDSGDEFSYSVALSADGSTLAVGASGEASAAIGIGGNQADNSTDEAGAVYVFTRSGTAWIQQAYIKASNPDEAAEFGHSVALSEDGSTLAVGAVGETSASTGIDGNQLDNSVEGAGAVYVFTRSDTAWSQQAYVKASNTGPDNEFGCSVALSGDGSTLAVGAIGESSAATDIGGDQLNDAALAAGAVYVFTRSGTTWSQQEYIKASNTGESDNFGYSVALSDDGSTLAVGAIGESSAVKGIDGNQDDDSALEAGAVYVFTRSGTTWSQQAYVKASNTDARDNFGNSVALSKNGSTLAVGAIGERSTAIGIDGDQANNSGVTAGAVYVFTRSGTAWSQQAYVKASNTGAFDEFGYSVALSADGSTLAVGADLEESKATGIDGNQADNSAEGAGAVYVFTHSNTTWSQQAYVKASNTGAFDEFGHSVALSADGSTLAVGAMWEDSAATGIFGDQLDNLAPGAGAVYVFMPHAWLP